MSIVQKTCQIASCNRKATSHHMLYTDYLRAGEKDAVLYLCEWHHKLITKTSFLKTMEMMFEDTWHNYRRYLEERNAAKKDKTD